MATSFGALCTDFYVNHKLAVKMDLPKDRETVLHLFDRVRAEIPEMSRFKRYSDELALESLRREGAYQWLALRKQSIRSGSVNPDTMDEGYRLHRLVMEMSPYFLTISPLDIEYVELMYGFDLECKTNQHEAVAEALYGGTPMAKLLDTPGAAPLEIQPTFGVTLLEESDLHVYYEVKARTTPSQVRNDRYRTEPLSIFLTLRRAAGIEKIDQLPDLLGVMRKRGEQLVNDQLIPHLLQPISRVIIGSV